MKSLVARYLGIVGVSCSVMLLALTVGCETEPDPNSSVTGTWTGLEDILDSSQSDRTLRWELALIDVPPDSIWGSARSQFPDQGSGWSLPQHLTGWRDGNSAVLEWGNMGVIGTRYEAEVSMGEDAPNFMTGRLSPGVGRRYYARLSVEKMR